MVERFDDRLNWASGYFPNQSLIGDGRLPDSIIDGKNIWVEGPGRVRSWIGPSAYSNALGNSILTLVGAKVGALGTGSIIRYTGGTVWFIGAGTPGVPKVGTPEGTFSTFSAAASTSLKLALDDTGATIITAGFSTRPDAPTCQVATSISASLPNNPVPFDANANSGAGNGVVGRAQGTFSFKVSPYRSTTGAEGNASGASNVVTANNNQIYVTVPLPLGNNAADMNDKWNIYATRRGFGGVGPWFFLARVTVGGATADQNNKVVVNSGIGGNKRTFQLDFSDGDLQAELAPIDFDAPFPGTHVFALGSVMIVAGVLGGAGLSPSIPGKPEAYPPDTITFLNPAEPITGIRGRASDGWQYVFCKNSLHAVSLGDDLNPIIPRAIWPNTGISNPNAAAFVQSEFYGFSGKMGAVRTSGTADPDSKFALAVEPIMETWDPNSVVVGYSHDNDCVVYFHKRTALVFKLKTEQWCPPFLLSDVGVASDVTSCVEYNGKLVFATGTTIYDFNGGSTVATPWFMRPAWRDGGTGGWYKTIYSWRTGYDIGAATNTLRGKLLTDFDDKSVREMQDLVGSGRASTDQAQYGSWKKTNIKDVKAYTIEYSGTGGNQLVYDCVINGGTTKMRA